NPTGGSFTVAYGGLPAVSVSYDPSFANLAANLQTALNTLLGAGNTKVLVSAGGASPVLDVYFTGQLAFMNVSNLTVTSTGLTGGTSPGVGVSSIATGSGNEVQSLTIAGITTGG